MKIITNKKGGYIVEASIGLPIFLIAMIVMSSIILMFTCIEDANFITATELRRAGAEAIISNPSAILPSRIENRINNHSQVDNLNLLDYGYRVNRWEQDDLIAIKMHMRMRTNNPLNLASEANYDVACVTRAYVGKERSLDNMSEEEMMADSTPVFIFPKRGEKYHSEGCAVLRAASRSTILSESLKEKYSSCPLCHSKNASAGMLVYYFPKEGESYHLPGCPSLERNYIEIEKRVAIKRGYMPCSKCGG